MKRARIACSAAIALLLGACRYEEPATTSITSGLLDAAASREAEEARRQEFMESAQTRLDHLEGRIHALEARGPHLSSGRRAELDAQVATLRTRHRAIKGAIHALPRLEGAAWDAEQRRIEAQLEEADRIAVEAAWTSEP